MSTIGSIHARERRQPGSRLDVTITICIINQKEGKSQAGCPRY
jgi:hypothetical protein